MGQWGRRWGTEGMSLQERIEFRTIRIPEVTCWYWDCYHLPNGYATVRVEGKAKLVHRVVYELAYGAISPDLEIDHLCRNKGCINPRHLEAVTHLINSRRGPKPTQTKCKYGHDYIVRPTGMKYCPICKRNQKRPSRAQPQEKRLEKWLEKQRKAALSGTR